MNTNVKSRLQRSVAESEFGQKDMSFGELCEAVASQKYAMEMGIGAPEAGVLIIKHGIITRCDKPDRAEEEDSETVEEQPAPIEPEPQPEAKVIKTFDEGGKGKKGCPNCDKFVGNRNKVCACGYDFKNGTKKVVKPEQPEDKVIKTFDEGGRGRKGCPNCDKFVGNRNKVCACGYDFKNGTKKVAKSAEPVEDKVIKTFDEGGRGRKGCPHCDKFVGIRHKFCACGHDFKNGTAAKVAKPVEDKVINTFNEGGQGRKECPNCHKFVSVCHKVCACDHTFEKKSKDIEIYDEEGRGRKECPRCKKFVGSRKPVCVCGHEFGRNGGNADSPEADVVDVLAHQKGAMLYEGRLKYVSTPAGECPYKLDGTDQQSVEEWADRVREKGLVDGRFYMVSALAYYAREFYDLNDDGHSVVKRHLCDYFADELAA